MDLTNYKGLKEAVSGRYGGLILDGRNRLHACELAQMAPRFIDWDGARYKRP